MTDEKFDEIRDEVEEKIYSTDDNTTKKEFDSIMTDIKDLNQFVRSRLDRSGKVIGLILNLQNEIKRLKKKKEDLYKQTPEYKEKIKKRNKRIILIGISIIAIIGTISLLINDFYIT